MENKINEIKETMKEIEQNLVYLDDDLEGLDSVYASYKKMGESFDNYTTLLRSNKTNDMNILNDLLNGYKTISDGIEIKYGENLSKNNVKVA